MTGLIIAADAGNLPLVSCLLEAGADVHACWSMQPALYYAEKRLAEDEDVDEATKARRQQTYDLLKEWSDRTPLPAPTPVKPLEPIEDLLGAVPPKPPLKYKPTATEDNVKELLSVVGNREMSDFDREDAAWALRHMTEPALAQRKRNVALLVSMGGVDILTDALCCKTSCHEIKEQSVAVLRNIARETASKKSIAHQIRKVIRQEAAKWAGLGTPESDARIKAMEQKINAAGGVCVVKSQEEIDALASTMPAVVP